MTVINYLDKYTFFYLGDLYDHENDFQTLKMTMTFTNIFCHPINDIFHLGICY